MSIYKDCDIRGIYEEEFNEQDIYEIGRAIGSVLTGKNVLICGDVRLSTPALKKELLNGLLKSGANVLNIGTEPTPVFYFAKGHLKADGGVMVTASHNPWQYNGLKISLGEQPIRVEDIEDIRRRVEQRDYTEGSGYYKQHNVEPEYIGFVHRHIKNGSKKVVVDAGGGVTAKLAPHMFREFGYDVVELFCEFDGKFSDRDPNPAVYAHLHKLQDKVRETGADFGVAFDGDGDRVVFVDDKGETVTSERSLCIFMQSYMKDRKSSVVYDLKSSSIVKTTAEKLGSEAIMERSGHTFIKRNFLKNNSVLAGEISGHFFFGELGHDDGIYAALKMGEILSGSSKSMSELVAEIPVTVITPDIRIKWKYTEQDALLEAIKTALQGKSELSYLDGVRAEFPHGWLLVRKSVTEEGVTLRIEADDAAALKEIVSTLLAGVPQLRGKNELLA